MQVKCLRSTIPVKIPPVISVIFIVAMPGIAADAPVITIAIGTKRLIFRTAKRKLSNKGHERI